MSTYFTEPRHDDLRASVRAFAEGEVRPLLPELEATRTVNHDLSRRIAQQGLLGVTIDEEHGGMGAGHLAKTIIIEELSRVCGAMGAMVQASQLGVAKIIHFGDDAQRKTWLPKVASGEVLPTIAVTDPASGGHVLGMQGTAVRDGNDYLLNGRKVFVGNSHVGDLHGVVLRTGEGSRGLTAFLVESDRPGFRLEPQQEAMGLHGFSFGELVFDQCRIPEGNRLGDEGQGLAVRPTPPACSTGGPTSRRCPSASTKRSSRRPSGCAGSASAMASRWASSARWPSSWARCSPG